MNPLINLRVIHSHSRSPAPEIRCPRCSKLCASRSGLKRHFRWIHPSETFPDDVSPENSLSDLETFESNDDSPSESPDHDVYFGNPWSHHSSPNSPTNTPQDGIDEDPIDEDALEHDEAGWHWEAPHDEGRDDSDDDSDDADEDDGDGVGEGQDDNSQSQDDTPIRKEYHPYLNGRICDEHGVYIPKDSPPPPLEESDPEDWGTFDNQQQFKTGEFLFRKNQMSGGDIDTLMKLWSESGATAPFQNHSDLYDRIDASTVGEARWDSFSVKYDGPPVKPGHETPDWMLQEYEAWSRDPVQLIRNLVANPDFADEFDYTPYHEYDHQGTHRFQDFMSGDWAWREADTITKDPNTHGAFLIAVIGGSDKTTVSVGTGNVEYHPIYLSVGNIHNTTRRAHRDGVVLLGFLPIPKTSKEYEDDGEFRKFRRQLFHTSIAQMFSPLKPGMTDPIVIRCADGHYRRAIFSLGPYIADYPEQCLTPNDALGEPNFILRRDDHARTLIEEFEILECWDNWGIVSDVVPFTDGFPRASIYELLAPDLLHQLIKGVFKDHLVTWVNDYLVATHGEKKAKKILADIDRRIAIVAPFSGLRRFPQGRGFKQWTGDDSKALMKVYLPAIEGYVPPEMLRTFRAFLEFCYLARKNVLDTNDLVQLKDALDRFHHYRQIFITVGVRENFNLPRQHSMVHFLQLVRAFGAPNGLCSSITESKHIKAVKEPWRRSSRYKATIQMLTTNTRLDKLAAMRTDFVRRGMLPPTSKPRSATATTTNRNTQSASVSKQPAHNDTVAEIQDGDEVSGPRSMASVELAKVPSAVSVDVRVLAEQLNQPNLKPLIQNFLHEQLNATAITNDVDPSSTQALPFFNEKINTYPSAQAIFYAPSDICGTGGMRRERIRAVPSWHKGPARYDTVFVETDAGADGMRALDVARIRSFFSFKFRGDLYPCALVHWLRRVEDAPDEDTGMWIVEPELDEDDQRLAAVIHLDTIFRAAHLIGIYGTTVIPKTLSYAHSLDAFDLYYINKYVDHHAFEIAS
ncbi:hypothetical protein HWV62_45085 [Athelia sp. TMB]|nr:hypothetical protein HWV62_45085 [Athelia sp. TMB]